MIRAIAAVTAGVSARSRAAWRSAMIAAAVSSIERRVTSMIGQPWRAQSLRVEGDLVGDRRLVDIGKLSAPPALRLRMRFSRNWTMRSGLAIRPTTSGRFAVSSCGGSGMPGTIGILAVLMPRLAR